MSDTRGDDSDGNEDDDEETASGSADGLWLAR